MTQVPFLMSSFFKDHPPTAELLKLAPMGPWSESCFPVHQWEDVWVVAGVDANVFESFAKELPASMIFVRAEADVLQEHWNRMHLPETGKSRSDYPEWFNREYVFEAQTLLDGLKSSYDRAMLLSFKDESFTPFLWTQGFSKDGVVGHYSCAEPSPFKLVEQTQLPYHGYVMENPTTKQFFADWKEDSNPENLTLVPLVESHTLFGMILCSGPSSTYTRAHLTQVERAAMELVTLMSQERTAA